MSKPHKHYYTHAQGEDHGWFGTATHPAHLDDDLKFIQGTEWTVRAGPYVTLAEAVEDLEDKVKERQHE